MLDSTFNAQYSTKSKDMDNQSLAAKCSLRVRDRQLDERGADGLLQVMMQLFDSFNTPTGPSEDVDSIEGVSGGQIA